MNLLLPNILKKETLLNLVPIKINQCGERGGKKDLLPRQWLQTTAVLSTYKFRHRALTKQKQSPKVFFFLTKKFKYILHSRGHWLPLSLRIAFSNKALIRCVRPVSGIVAWTSLPPTLQGKNSGHSKTTSVPNITARHTSAMAKGSNIWICFSGRCCPPGVSMPAAGTGMA